MLVAITFSSLDYSISKPVPHPVHWGMNEAVQQFDTVLVGNGYLSFMCSNTGDAIVSRTINGKDAPRAFIHYYPASNRSAVSVSPVISSRSLAASVYRARH